MADIKRIAKQVYDFMIDGHDCTQRSYCEQAVEKCVRNKSALIDMLSKHPNWDEENLRIHFDVDYLRAKDVTKAKNCLHFIGENLIASVDESTDSAEYNRRVSLPDIGDSFYLRGNPLRNLGEMLAYMPTIKDLFVAPNVTEAAERVVKAILPDARIHNGQKTTRALFGLLKQYNWQDALSGKNKQAQLSARTGEIVETDAFTRARQYYNDYTDAMNPLTITRHTVLSVNPMDFLRMSYGNSWSSCHFIDDGSGSDSDGGWSAGCWSYAYDGQTMIYYTVDGNVSDENLTYADKYTRQLFHWNGEALMPARLYPQSFNCSPDAAPYLETRAIVEKIVSDCKGIGNMWKKLSIRSYDANIHSRGHHYRDYKEMINAPIFVSSFLEYNKSDEELAEFLIGSDDAICVGCGGRLDESDYPICSYCSGGGRYCEHCGRYDDDGEYVNGEWVCRSCLEDYYVWDDLNERYIREDESIYVYGLLGERMNGYTDEDECGYGGIFYCEDCGRYFNSDYYKEYFTANGVTICEDCFNADYEECSRCGEVYLRNRLMTTADGEYVCDNCVAEDEFVCAGCGQIHKIEDLAEELCRKKYCAECYENKRRVCEECGVIYYEDDNTRMFGEIGDRVCPDCLTRYYDRTVDGRYMKVDSVGLASSEYIYGVRRWNGSTIELIHRNQLASLDLYEVFVPVEIIDEVFPMFSESFRSVMKSTVGSKLMKNEKYYYRCRVGEECRSEDGEEMVSYKNRYIAWLLAHTEEEAA